MPANQSTKTERDRDFRELDLSISSNLSEREGKKERTVGAKSVWREFKSQNVFWNRGKIKEGKEINGKKTVVLLLSKCTGVLILKGVPKVLYLSFALDKMLMRRVNPKKKRMICLLQNSYLKKKKKKKRKKRRR